MLTKKITKHIERLFPIPMDWIRYKRGNNKNWLVRKNILDYYKNVPESEIEPEKQEAIDYIAKKGARAFPYSFIEKYNYSNIKVYQDSGCGLRYVLHNGKKLYFARNISSFYIQRLYNSLLIEQDEKSPHYYEKDNCKIENKDILIDIGAAEGILSLSMIDRVKKVYLFEREERWLEALEQTFKPWANKVVIINKYVSDEDSDTTIKIDSVTKGLDKEALFLKIDVEGAEESVINGAKETLSSGKFATKAVVCTYHNQNDLEKLSTLMHNHGYQSKNSQGYMLFLNDELSAPFFRRGVIYCTKKD